MRVTLDGILEQVDSLEEMALDCECAREKLATILAKEILQRKQLREKIYELENELKQYRTLDEGGRKRYKPKKHR